MASDDATLQQDGGQRAHPAPASVSYASLPLYRRITDALTQQIARGEFPLGSLLPPEVELARRFGVSRHTMRAGLDALVRAGLLERRRGKGTVVTRLHMQQSLQHFYSIEQEMRRRGADLRTQVLARGHLEAGDELAARACAALGIDEPQRIYALVRLRLVDGIPLLLENLTFPAALCPLLAKEPEPGGEDMATRSFYDALFACSNMRVTRAHESFRPVPVMGYEAHVLRAAVGTPVFEVERTSYAGALAVEWRRTLARGDRYTYAVDLLNPTDSDEAG